MRRLHGPAGPPHPPHHQLLQTFKTSQHQAMFTVSRPHACACPEYVRKCAVTLQGGGSAGAECECCRIRRGLNQALNVCGLHLHNGMQRGFVLMRNARGAHVVNAPLMASKICSITQRANLPSCNNCYERTYLLQECQQAVQLVEVILQRGACHDAPPVGLQHSCKRSMVLSNMQSETDCKLADCK